VLEEKGPRWPRWPCCRLHRQGSLTLANLPVERDIDAQAAHGAVQHQEEPEVVPREGERRSQAEDVQPCRIWWLRNCQPACRIQASGVPPEQRLWYASMPSHLIKGCRAMRDPIAMKTAPKTTIFLYFALQRACLPEMKTPTTASVKVQGSRLIQLFSFCTAHTSEYGMRCASGSLLCAFREGLGSRSRVLRGGCANSSSY
jgi:hypothetical protein